MARFSLARYGVMWLALVRSCPARLRNARQGIIGARRAKVEQSTLRHGFIRVLRCLAEWGPALGQVLFGSVKYGKVWKFMVRSAAVARGTVGRGFVWFGVLRCCADRWGKLLYGVVLRGKVLLWSGEVVLLGSVGWIGALYARVRSYCGVVWSREALHGIVKFGPVKHCTVMLAKALFRHGTVGSGFARLRAGQGLVRRYFGIALRGWVMRGRVGFGYGNVRLQK